jgi:hypothetical protein
MHIITARTSKVRRLEDHQTIFGLVSFDTNQGQIHVEVTIQPETQAELTMPQAAMIAEAKRKLRLGNQLPTEVISMTVHDMLMSRVA